MPSIPPLIGNASALPDLYSAQVANPALFGTAPNAQPTPPAFAGGIGGTLTGNAAMMPPGGSGSPYQSFIPPMAQANYNPGGGFMPTPMGGQWNQLAQQMAGPMFLPSGVKPSVSPLFGAPNPVGMPQQPTPPPSATPLPVSVTNPNLAAHLAAIHAQPTLGAQMAPSGLMGSGMFPSAMTGGSPFLRSGGMRGPNLTQLNFMPE